MPAQPWCRLKKGVGHSSRCHSWLPCLTSQSSSQTVLAELLDGQAATNCWGRGSESRGELCAYHDEELADAHMGVEVVAAALAPIDKCAD